MLDKLLVLANELDKKGYYDLADSVDGIIIEAAPIHRPGANPAEVTRPSELIGPIQKEFAEYQKGIAESKGKPWEADYSNLGAVLLSLNTLDRDYGKTFTIALYELLKESGNTTISYILGGIIKFKRRKLLGRRGYFEPDPMRLTTLAGTLTKLRSMEKYKSGHKVIDELFGYMTPALQKINQLRRDAIDLKAKIQQKKEQYKSLQQKPSGPNQSGE
jgi:hypothetical protein